LDDALALLRLQVEWGVDEALDADPIDRFTAIDPPRSGEAGPTLRARPVPALPMGSQAERALALAMQAATLDELRTTLASFDGCALRDTASNLVFAEGNPSSPILIIGEPPGREEDRSGHPFAGPEGQLLDQMLASIGLTRSELMLTPLLPWRPPGGRPPSPAEIAICQPFLHRLIALLNPDRLVLFGATAARSILPQSQNRRRNPRGWVEAAMSGVHGTRPALSLPGLGEMLKNPPLRRDAWAALRLLRRTIDGTPPLPVQQP
jgi:uracil-DNA glycosylase